MILEFRAPFVTGMIVTACHSLILIKRKKMTGIWRLKSLILRKKNVREKFTWVIYLSMIVIWCLQRRPFKSRKNTIKTTGNSITFPTQNKQRVKKATEFSKMCPVYSSNKVIGGIIGNSGVWTNSWNMKSKSKEDLFMIYHHCKGLQ